MHYYYEYKPLHMMLRKMRKHEKSYDGKTKWM